MWSDRTKIALGEKYFEIRNSQTTFCRLYVKLTTVQLVNLLLVKQQKPL